MKRIIVRIVLAVSGYQVPVQELESRLSAIAPVRIEVIDLANPQPVENFYELHYQLAKMKVSKDAVVFLHAGFQGGLSGGKASYFYKIANVAVVPGYDDRNQQVLTHEILHLWGVSHNDEDCNLMNPQPCGVEIREQDVLRAKKFLKRKRR